MIKLRDMLRYHYLLLVVLLVLWGMVSGSVDSYARRSTIIPVTTCNEASLRTAITGASAGDTIAFQCSGTITLAGTLALDKNLTMDGSGQAITLDGNLGLSRCYLSAAG